MTMTAPETAIEATVENLEACFEDYVTRTPLKLDFTAAEIAAHYVGVEVQEVSQWLQTYRSVQGGATTCSSEYVVATYNRGRGSIWHILSWPGMTPSQEDSADSLRIIYEVMSYLREDIDPMLRNVAKEFIPATIAKRLKGSKSQIGVMRSKLDGYYAGLQRFQREINRVVPVRLRSTVRPLDALITQRLARIDSIGSYLATL